MATSSSTTLKKTTRAKKTIQEPQDSSAVYISSSPSTTFKALSDTFTILIEKVEEARRDFENLKKEIEEVKQKWAKEQKQHEQEVLEKREQEETERKREEETYRYETSLIRKKAEDEFAERKEKWEKELAGQKEEIVKDKKELEELRKLVASFESEKEKAVKQAVLIREKELKAEFDTERTLANQEFKSEKEILSLKIEGLLSENARQAKEIETLKKALEEATRQLKEIAVKVIESGRTDKPSSPQET